jgi:hypothetical protein
VENAIITLSRVLIETNQIYTLTQIEELTKLQDSGVDVGLLKNGWATFFLVLNKQGGVSVVHVYRFDGPWYVYVYSLDNDYVWPAEHRFFSRN